MLVFSFNQTDSVCAKQHLLLCKSIFKELIGSNLRTIAKKCH